jgi:acyl carrier protein
MSSLEKIISEALNLPEDHVNETLVRDKTPEWDSFTHLLLIAEIEKRLNIHFTMQEVNQIHNYADLKTIVAGKK